MHHGRPKAAGCVRVRATWVRLVRRRTSGGSSFAGGHGDTGAWVGEPCNWWIGPGVGGVLANWSIGPGWVLVRPIGRLGGCGRAWVRCSADRLVEPVSPG